MGGLVGAALTVSGLALNPLSLAFLFPQQTFGTQGVIALQILLIFAGGWLCWRRPSLTPMATVVGITILGALSVLGFYGTFGSLQGLQERRARMSALDRSEDLQQHLSAETLPLLAAGVYQRLLPAALGRTLFADTVDVVDIASTSTSTALELHIGSQQWRIKSSARYGVKQLALWRPLLSSLASVDHAAFHIETAGFADIEEKSYRARLHFDALGRMPEGQRVQIRARLRIRWRLGADAVWHIDHWTTEELTVLRRADPLFTEVLNQALPNGEHRARARSSQHAALVRRSFIDSTFRGPHRYFTRQAFDRHPGVSVVDIDADGYDDIYVLMRRGRNMLWHNQGDGTFVERAADYGLDIEHHSAAALFADFDNDGDQDAFIGRTLVPSLYLVNEQGHFVARDLGIDALPSLVTSLAAADYDRDGLLDIYFATYAARMLLDEVNVSMQAEPLDGGEMLANFLPAALARKLYRMSRTRVGDLARDAPGPPNALLRNLGDNRFAPVSTDAAVWRNTLQAAWADYDRDGDADLYLANDFAANNMLRNDGGTLVDITAHSGTADPGFGMGASWGDYDDDGRQDLYVTNMYSHAGLRITAAVGFEAAVYARMARGNSLFRNKVDGLVRVSGEREPAIPVEDGGWAYGGQFVDIDNDGDLDLYVPNGYYTPPTEVAIAEDS